MTVEDDLAIYHAALVESFDAQVVLPVTARGMRQILESAWRQVEHARKLRADDWLRRKGLGDLVDDVPTEEPVPPGMRVCDCPNGEADRTFCDCPVDTSNIPEAGEEFFKKAKLVKPEDRR